MDTLRNVLLSNVVAFSFSFLKFCLWFTLAAVLFDACFEIFSYIRLVFRVKGCQTGCGTGMESTDVDLHHCVSFFLLSIAYRGQGIWKTLKALKLYLLPSFRQKALPTDPVSFLLENILILHSRPAPELGDSARRMQIKDFLVVTAEGKRDGSILIEFDIETRLVAHFEYCGAIVSDHAERLHILLHTVATVAHPAVHHYQDRHYTYRKKAGREYNNMFLHGPLLNEFACFYVSFGYHASRAWTSEVANTNADLVQPPHHDMDFLNTLRPYSTYVQFSIESRKLIFKLVKKHNVNVDPELLFINSVLHSLDHYSTRKYENMYIENKVTWNRPLSSTILRLIFFSGIGRNELFGTNYLVDIQDKNPFYKELYQGLVTIDEEVAKNIMMSIAC